MGLNQIKSTVRRCIRGLQRAEEYPVLLPPHRLAQGELCTLERPARPLSAPLALALSRCDGNHTLREVARHSGARRSHLIDLHDCEYLLLWREALRPPPPADSARVRAIILSAHPDDAPLSLGGFMLQHEPGQVLVLDLFTQTAWTRLGAELQGAARVQPLRDAEERLMARLAGAALRGMDWPEAVLRGYRFEDIFTAKPIASDGQWVDAIAQTVAETATRFRQAAWYLPLGVGGHIDHRLARDAALAGLRQPGFDAARIHFFEDLPYAANLPGLSDFSSAVPGLRLAATHIDIQPLLRWKLELNRAYWSQFQWRQLRLLQEYAQRLGRGRAQERIWRLQTM